MVFRDERAAMMQRLAELEHAAAENVALRRRVAELEAENHRLTGAVRELEARLAPPPRAPVPRTGAGWLALRIHGPEGVRDQTFDVDVVKLGRATSAQVQLQHADVSRVHAVIERSPGGPNLVDLGSSSGTLVNGRKITNAKLAAGDRIQIGPYTIDFALLA